ncbi:MAG: hypothetical protein CMK89_18100 [Pseudomonadales bacterium]|nr:hypothetical protein [Pseudomonadales bacterium]
MRVLHIDYQQIRRYGKNHGNWVEKLAFGMIKNGHYLQSFSDRDVAAFESPFGLRDLGWKRANRRAVEMVEAVAPELIVLGHCDKITNNSVAEMRKVSPHSVIVHCNCDPLFVPYNVDNIQLRAEVCDAVFVTTGVRELEQFKGKRARAYHIPNPVDESIETLDNSLETDLPIDLLFCSNATKYTSRGKIVQHVKDALDSELAFHTYGSFGMPAVWGREYDRVLAQSRMGLNLNRQEGNYWYASDRMAQLAGSGILQFTSDQQRFDELFPEETIVYFSDESDLVSKIREFHHDDARRRAWAANARRFFFAEMNTRLYAQYIVEAAFEKPFSHDYVWHQE